MNIQPTLYNYERKFQNTFQCNWNYNCLGNQKGNYQNKLLHNFHHKHLNSLLNTV